MNKIKKTALVTTLAASMVASLASCSKEETQYNELTTTETQTTQATTEEVNIYEQQAIESYNQYKDFYDSFSVGVTEIENMIKIINDDLSGLTQEDLRETVELIGNILSSVNLGQKIDNIKTGVEDENILPDAPKLSIYVEDENIKSDLQAYEEIRDQLTNSANKGVISENDKETLRNAVIDMEHSFDKHQDYMKGNIIKEGNCYLQYSWKYALAINAGQILDELDIVDSDGHIYPLKPTGDESITIARYQTLQSCGETIPDDLEIEYADIRMRLIKYKYERFMENTEAEISVKLPENSNLYSEVPISEKINQLNLLKEELSSKYEYTDSGNVYSYTM